MLVLVGLYIFQGDDFASPLYAEPTQREAEPEVWEAATQRALAVYEGEGEPVGVASEGDWRIGWRAVPHSDVVAVAVVSDEVQRRDLERFLKDLVTRYVDEVDDPSRPDRHGVADVVVDVVPPWEAE